MTGIAGNHDQILERIGNAARRAGRSPESIQLVAVTKTVAPERIQEAIRCGVKHIGENRVQEALSKREALANANVTWHFIGHFQTNKAKKVVENFDWIHSVDRIDAAEALARHVANREPLRVLIEVKLHDEPNKSGVAEEDLAGLIASIRRLDSLDLRGLMAVPPPVEAAEQARPFFRRLHQLAQDFGLSELSMGMTHDFEVAVEEGATMVRIGTGLFGERS
jgi:pyridoxal phosphate enzyme (YggS family)